MHLIFNHHSDNRRARSAGVLAPDEARALQAAGVPLAYDPVQIGWVPEHCLDDMGQLQRWQAPHPHPLGRTGPAARGPDLRLRRWADSDAPALAGMLSDPQLWRFMPEGYGGPVTPDQARDVITIANQANHHAVWAITQDDLPIGQLRLEYGAEGDSTAELSYWIAEAQRGKGIARRAIARLLQDLPQSGQAPRRLLVRIHRDNAASLRVAHALGFADRDASGDWLHLDRAL